MGKMKITMKRGHELDDEVLVEPHCAMDDMDMSKYVNNTDLVVTNTSTL